MSAEAATAIESQVRELIRKRGVDPVRDVGAVRTMVDDALASWEQRALVGAVAPYEDRVMVAKSVLDNDAGLAMCFEGFRPCRDRPCARNAER